MSKDNEFQPRQLMSLGLVIMLAPALRIFPAESAALAGRAMWLCPLAAAPLLLGYMHFLTKLMGCREDGENFQDLALRALGPGMGKPALALMSLWMLLYSGFILRAGVDRLIVTTYPNSSPASFTVVMGAISLCAALSTPRSLVRMARTVRPVVLGVLLLLFIFACFSVDIDNLYPLTGADVIPALMGSAVSVDIVCCSAMGMCLVLGGIKKQEGAYRRLCLWTAEALAVLSLLGIAVVGSFGAELSANLSRPFFVLVKNMVFFRTVERVEALVVMLWIFPDFLLTSLFLWAGQYSIRLILGVDANYTGRALDFSNGRFVIWLAATAVTLFALFIAPDAMSLELWSAYIIPALNLSFAFLFFPLIYIIGKEKGRI